MDDKQVYTDLGRLGAQIDSLTETVQQLRHETKEDREFLKDKLAKLDELDREFKEAKPVIKDINKWKERTIGAVMAASAASAIITSYGTDIIAFFRHKVG